MKIKKKKKEKVKKKERAQPFRLFYLYNKKKNTYMRVGTSETIRLTPLILD